MKLAYVYGMPFSDIVTSLITCAFTVAAYISLIKPSLNASFQALYYNFFTELWALDRQLHSCDAYKTLLYSIKMLSKLYMWYLLRCELSCLLQFAIIDVV